MASTPTATTGVKWSLAALPRALDPRTSGTEVRRRLGLKIEKRALQVVRRVEDFWLEERTDDWIAAYRIVAANGRPWIGEIRVFPVGTFKQRPEGEWVEGLLAGVRASVPAGGVTGKILAHVKPQRWRRIAEHVIRSLYRDGAEARKSSLKLFRPYGPKRARSPRGRKALSDAFMEQIAREHTEARDAGVQPTKSLMKKHGAPESRVRGWIHRARRRGFLEKPVLQGTARGTLAAKTAT